jgi:hypothetical protein
LIRDSFIFYSDETAVPPPCYSYCLLWCWKYDVISHVVVALSKLALHYS